MTDSDREEDVKEKLTELTKASGVEGAERLAALFLRKHGDLARTMSMAKIKGLSNEVLKKRGQENKSFNTLRTCLEAASMPRRPMRYGRPTPPACSPLVVGIFFALLMSLHAALGRNRWLRPPLAR